MWASNIAPQFVAYIVNSDVHSPNSLRVNAALPMIDAWYAAFGIKEGDKLLFLQTSVHTSGKKDFFEILIAVRACTSEDVQARLFYVHCHAASRMPVGVRNVFRQKTACFLNPEFRKPHGIFRVLCSARFSAFCILVPAHTAFATRDMCCTLWDAVQNTTFKNRCKRNWKTIFKGNLFSFGACAKKHMAYRKKYKPCILKYKALILK